MASAADYDPLQLLESQIAEASTLPSAQPYLRNDDPLGLLRARIRGEDQAANDDAAPATPTVRADSTAGVDSGIETMIGREVLAMVGSRPLPPEAREEAVRRLLIALQNPAPDNIRSVLAVIVTGRDDA